MASGIDNGGRQWGVDSVFVGETDVTDQPFEVRGDSFLAQVTLTAALAELSGRLLNQNGVPNVRHSIVVFPSDAAPWAFPSRRVRIARPSPDGRFHFAGLPPGSYSVLAVANMLETLDLADPNFMESLRTAPAVRVTLLKGERRDQTLQVR